MPYVETVFSGPVRVDVVEEIAPTPRGRRFVCRVSTTHKPYHKGERMEESACDIWDASKPSKVSIRRIWIGKTWLDAFPSTPKV
jgi:hypothetical protein